MTAGFAGGGLLLLLLGAGACPCAGSAASI